MDFCGAAASGPKADLSIAELIARYRVHGGKTARDEHGRLVTM